MEEQLNPNEVPQEMHPDLAFQVGVYQEKKEHDIHPSLQAEIQAQPIEPMVEKQTPEAVEMVENPTTVEEPTVDGVSTVQASPAKERQWKELKAKALQAERLAEEREQLSRELEYYKSQQHKQVSQDEDADDYATNRKFKELEQRQRELEERTRKAEQQSAISRAERQLVEDYPDIREVVSDENIKRLEEEYPHLYKSVIASSDVYTVGAAAHEMIMAKGIYKKTILPSNNANNAKRNAAKPASASQVAANSGTTPIARANSYMGNSISSEDERKAIWAEMQSSAYGRR